MVWMTFFHFCFDLSFFGYWPQDFLRDPMWTWQRTAIVSLFLFCAGLGQAVAWSQAVDWRRFGRRWGLVVMCAALVSIGSYWMFPRSFIYFGVLHGMAVMLLVVRLTAVWGRWLWLAGLIAIVVPWIAAVLLAGPLQAFADVFNARAANWLGLVSRKPFTEDYVPVFPWLGVMWWGLVAGQWLLAQRRAWIVGGVPRLLRPLAVLGRWSLSYYMLHQPVMLSALALSGMVASR